jgi:protein involved in polysaccharide export with SLBB domain
MMRLTWLAVVLSLAAVVAPVATAAPVSSGAPAARSGYQLRPEDVVEITVLGLPQLDKTVTILPDGTITYPRLDTIKAEGMTLQELKEYLYKGLDRFYNNLDITVTVKSLHADRVTVRGAVRTPGSYEMRPGWTVRELLAAAGDLATTNGPPVPDQMRATLIRRSGERIALNMAQLLAQEGAANLPILQPDDMLIVEDLTIQVNVDGQVVNPSSVSLPPGSTVLDALRAAKGPTDKAALSRAYIRRGAQMIPVNLLPFRTGNVQNASLPVMQRLDSLYIPENKEKVLVWGGVQRPGPYLIPEDEPLTITSAILLAGGTLPRAGLKKVSLLHKVGPDYKETVVNLEDVIHKSGDLSRDRVLQPGDMVCVPDPKQPSTFNPFNLLPLLLGL